MLMRIVGDMKDLQLGGIAVSIGGQVVCVLILDMQMQQMEVVLQIILIMT